MSQTQNLHVTVELVKSHCLPLILFVSETVSFSASNVPVLVNRILRTALYKIIGIGDTSCLLQTRTYLGHYSLWNA